MNAVEVVAFEQKIVLAYIPHKFAGFIADATVGRCRDEATLMFFEVALIFEGQTLAQGLLPRDRIVGRGVEFTTGCRWRLFAAAGRGEDKDDQGPVGDSLSARTYHLSSR